MTHSDAKHIVVVGMGYVGIPCAALFADVPGFRVTGIQRRSPRSGWKIDCLNAGQSPFEGDEPGLAELIARVAGKGTFRVTDDFSVCRDADTILIDVQTPVEEDRQPRFESLREASQQVGTYLQPGTLVVVESTVAPGTTQGVVQPILERESGLKAGGRDQETRRGGESEAGENTQAERATRNPQHESRFYLAFSYERVMPGKLLEYITDFPRVVGGVDGESTRRAVELYRHIVRAAITPTDVLTAEVAKVVENAYRDVNIAFVNEVARACEAVGVDVYEVRALINARPDRHLHVPGAGVGGHCLPKDPWLLVHGVRALGDPVRPVEMPLVALARAVNDGMPAHVAELTRQALAEDGQTLAGARVAVLGVAYLEEADDTRNTPAIPLIERLLEAGAHVVAHDPYVRVGDTEWLEAQAHWRAVYGQEVALTRDLETALRGADAAVLVTRHQAYRAWDWAQVGGWMRGRAVVDGRNVWDAAACRAAGFVYRGVGKGR